MSAIKQFFLFAWIQAQAAIFGGLLLFFILLTEFVDFGFGVMHRFDVLFIFALITQGALVALKLESKRELMVVTLFHLVATGMELFKTSDAVGSWTYPDAAQAIFTLQNVPLFAGFMYSAVGSYIARAWRLMDLRYDPFPKPIYTLMLAILIYVNFFTHHYVLDLRYLLLMISVIMFGRVMITFTIGQQRYKMPFIVAGGLTAFFIWIAENISTFGTIWLYPNQMSGWSLVSPHKMLAWYLLLLLSFGMVSVIKSQKNGK